MSDRVLGSNHSHGTCKKSEHACESSWMARWTHLGCASTVQDKTRFPVKPENDYDCNKTILSDGSEIAARDSSLAKRSRKAGSLEDGMNESPRKIKPSSMFNIFQQKVIVTSLKNDRTSVCLPPRIAAPGIFAASDSCKETSGMPVGCFQATDHLPTVEETDVNASTKLKGKSYCDFLNLFPDLCSRHQQGAKPHPEYDGGLTEDEKQRTDGVKSLTVGIKNESSAETDIFNVDYVQKNRLSGITQSAANKAVKRKLKMLASEIPDMNQEPPVVPDNDESSKDSDKQTSGSKTQSFNMDHCISNTGELFSEPGYRWVKRLKTSALNSTGHSTKSLSTEKGLPSEKVNDFLGIMKCRNPSSEKRNLKPLVKNSKDQDITLLHPWIQRWCTNKRSRRTADTEVSVSNEPGSSKGKIMDDQFQKKQFPSIAAIALMGKALNGFSPSELRKRGSLCIWRTRDIT